MKDNVSLVSNAAIRGREKTKHMNEVETGMEATHLFFICLNSIKFTSSEKQAPTMSRKKVAFLSAHK